MMRVLEEAHEAYRTIAHALHGVADVDIMALRVGYVIAVYGNSGLWRFTIEHTSYRWQYEEGEHAFDTMAPAVTSLLEAILKE